MAEELEAESGMFGRLSSAEGDGYDYVRGTPDGCIKLMAEGNPRAACVRDKRWQWHRWRWGDPRSEVRGCDNPTVVLVRQGMAI